MRYLTLHNGVKMPQIGLGTFRATGDNAKKAIISAIEIGYRMIDTAKVYENETALKDALKESNVDRKDLWITSKVWTTEFTEIEKECRRALEATGLEYFDLYLLHWPRSEAENANAWKQMESLYQKGLVKAIGVSNFQIHHMRALMAEAKIAPMVNQVECHPNLPQYNLQIECQKYDCYLEAYCSFMKNEGTTKEQLVTVAKRYNVPVNSIILAWLIERGIIVIPMSLNEKHQRSNLESLEIKLDSEDIALISEVNKAVRYYPDPDNHKF